MDMLPTGRRLLQLLIRDMSSVMVCQAGACAAAAEPSPLPICLRLLPLLAAGTVDVILSYCHYSLNDTTLQDAIPYFQEKQVPRLPYCSKCRAC